MHTFSFALHEVAPYINWLYFFHAWGFPARLGSIAKVHGCEACRQNWLFSFKKAERTRAREAMRLYDEAQHLLQNGDSLYHTHGKVALLPAYSEGEDIIVSTADGERRIPLLRQQRPNQEGNCLCLSDFIQPHHYVEASPYSQLGIFACTTDREMEEQHADDEFLHLLHQTLADRLAEATAEKLHEMVRTQLWGYAPNEKLTLEDLFAERYQGKRPAVGYPSLPDQSLNFILDEIIDFKSIGISLTENGAMRPHASTSGLMLAHPATCHFSIGEIGDDQLQEYAQRKGMTVEAIRKFIQ